MAAETVTFSPAALEKVQEILGRYPTRQAALMPVLWLAQREFGWLSPEVRAYVADLLGLSPATVEGVASFYTMYHKRPPGRHVIWLCGSISCMLLGHERIQQHLEQKLGIRVGETTPDGRFSLFMTECIGGCGTAPAMLVDDDYHDRLTPERVDEILEKYP